MSTTVRTILYKYQPLKSGQLSIYIRFVKDRKVKEFPIAGQSSMSEWWNEQAGLPNKRHPHQKELTILLNTIKIQAQKLILSFENEGVDYSLEELISNLRSDKRRRKVTVLNFILEDVRQEKIAGRIGTGDVFKATHNSLSQYRKGKDFEFSDVTFPFLTRYEDWLGTRNVKPNTKFLYLRTFKTLLNRAKKEGLVKAGYDPFKNMDFAKYRKVKTRKRALSLEVMDQVKRLQVGPESSLFLAHRLFLFSYHAWGINFVDIALLKWSNIREKDLFYTRKKTSEDFLIGIHQENRKVLDYCRTQFYGSEEDYIFPLDRKRHLTPNQINNRIDKVLKEVNAALKEIGTLAGSPVPLTTYVARHTFATALKKKDVSTAKIQEMLGHDSERTTQIYLDCFENEILNKIAADYL